jgi:hypothetical protein
MSPETPNTPEKDINVPSASPYMAGYLAMRSELQPSDILELPDIPSMIDRSSTESVACDPSLGDLLTNEQYPAVLQQTLKLMEERTASTGRVRVILLPDIADSQKNKYVSHLYIWRFTRLAQDTGKVVVMSEPESGTKKPEQAWIEFMPPMAPSATAYWQAKTARVDAATFRIRNTAPHRDEILMAIKSLCEGYEARSKENMETLPLLLLTSVASGDINAVRESSEGQQLLAIIRGLAYGRTTVSDDLVRSRVRLALAKMQVDKEIAVQTFKNEVRERDTFRSPYTTAAWPKILAEYMRDDPELRTEALERLEFLSSRPSFQVKAQEELRHLSAALCQTNDLRVGHFLSRFMGVPTATRSVHNTLLKVILDEMPQYIDTVQAMEVSPEQQELLAALEKGNADLMENILTGRLDHLDFFPCNFDYPAEMLIKFGNPKYRNLLSRFMLQHFEDHGSIISEHQFERMYISYRKKYGDIPEILRHVTILAEPVADPESSPSAAQ